MNFQIYHLSHPRPVPSRRHDGVTAHVSTPRRTPLRLVFKLDDEVRSFIQADDIAGQLLVERLERRLRPIIERFWRRYGEASR